jgi:hypothetical protein
VCRVCRIFDSNFPGEKMPTRKPHLNKAEQAKYLLTLRQLQASGIEIPNGLLEDSRALDITVGQGPATSVFDSSRGIFYAPWVRLVAEQPCTLLGCRMRTDWDENIVLRSFDEERRVCRLGPLSFAREEVLNQRIENGLRFERRGDWFEGMILANGLRPIPEKYLDGASAPFQLIFEDVYGDEIIETARLFVVRTHRERLPEQRGTGLYGPRRSAESRRLAAPGNLPRAKPRPTVPEYGDDALGSLKYREGRDRIQSET